MPNLLSPIIKIAKYTLADEVRQKSFIVMFVICALFIFFVRGCYQGDFMVNGQEVEAGKVVIMVSKITFNVIAAGVMFLAALLSMRVFRRDREDGTQSCVLSKPITRRQYVAGKILGLWILSVIFMFVLHTIVFTITSVKLKVVMPEYLVASALCSFNLLFVVIAVLLFSLLMPDIAALLLIIGIGIAGLVVDGIFAMSRSPMGQAVLQTHAQPDLTLGQGIYYLWPKLSGMQSFASSFIGADGLGAAVSVYPLMNILIYCLVLGVLLFWSFSKEDIT
ncbi:MAG: ABC transporter permease subunit [Smithella sp.]|jgi:ABC-type transport system involved in multi-copper enzyme maturation permease subunit